MAARQHGVISHRQARELGLSRSAVARKVWAGKWAPLFPAVYRVEGTPPTWRQRLKALSLWAARDYAISHFSAAALHGLGRVREGALEVSVARDLRRPAPVIVHRVQAVLPKDLASVDGLRVTSVTKTLVDLSARVDGSWLKAALDQALSRRWATLDKLQAALERAAGFRGVDSLRRHVDALLGGAAPTESELEARVAELLDTAGLPRPICQHVVRTGGRVRRLDFRIPGTPVVIEADGYAYHSSLEAFERDRRRDNELVELNLKVLHWTWAAVRDRPEELLAQLRRTLHPGRGRLEECPAR